MQNQVAPVVVFVYNRPDLAKKTLESLKKDDLAQYTDLFIFSDGEKNLSQKENVRLVREYIHKIDGFKSVKIFEAAKNKGLAESVISGVTRVINEYGRIIVLEDDLIISRQFLSFMNDALNFYECNNNVWSISGYQLPFEMPKTYKESVYAAYRASSWGWGTWADRWNSVDWEILDFDSYKHNPWSNFMFCRGGRDLNKMLCAQMNGEIDSWAIRWCYNQFKQKKMTIYPVKSLVNNIGNDGRGTHCDSSCERYQQIPASNFKYVLKNNISIDYSVMRRYRKFVNRPVLDRVRNHLKKWV